MLVIRKEQMDVLERGTLAAFEERMMLHLRRSFPVKCDELGDTGVLRRIRAGTAKAASFGIATRRDVARYINLMFTYGEGFDADPALPWASAILNTTYRIPDTKMQCLYAEAQKYMVQRRDR